MYYEYTNLTDIIIIHQDTQDENNKHHTFDAGTHKKISFLKKTKNQF